MTAIDDPLSLAWVATPDLNGLAALFGNVSRMAGPNTTAVAAWGKRALAAVNAELQARAGADPAPATVPAIDDLNDTEIYFLAQVLNGARSAALDDAGGAEGVVQWVERMADVIVAELAGRAKRRADDDEQ